MNTINKLERLKEIGDDKLFTIEFILYGEYRKLINRSTKSTKAFINSDWFKESYKVLIKTNNELIREDEIIFNRGF